MIKALKELESIIETMDHWERFSGFEKWKEKWLNKTEATQLVLNRSRMTSDEHDFTCEYVAKLCIDEMIENGSVDFNIESNCYTATIWSLKHEKPKESKKSRKVSK